MYRYGPGHLKDFLLTGRFKKPFRLCMEVTNRCNLKCKTCYWRRNIPDKELSDLEWEKRIEIMLSKSPSILQAIWMGGEPMLRFGLIKKYSKKFCFNHVFTNGTLPIYPVKNLKYTVSIDGTNDFFSKQRGNVYELIRENLRKSKVSHFSILFLISQLNKDNIVEFIEEWSRVRKVTRIIFSFYVPSRNEHDFNLWIPLHERDRIIDRLKKLSYSHPKIREGSKHLDPLYSENLASTVKECHVNKHNYDIHLDSEGMEKFLIRPNGRKNNFTCAFYNPDCNRCGSDPMARSKYMSQNRFSHLKKVFARHIFKKS